MYLEDSIRQLVKDIDPRFDVRFNHTSEGYEITQRSPLGAVSVFDFVRYDRLSKSFFDNIRLNVYVNRNGDPLRELTENNERIERRREDREQDNIDYLVKSTAPRLQRALGEV